MSEREQEREEFLKEVEKLKNQLHDKEKHSDTEGRLQREVLGHFGMTHFHGKC